MATYVVGDLQGCCSCLERLLARIPFDASVDRLWLVGDLVNRGAESLRVLRTIRALGDVAVTVLGNHDLHLLAVFAGARRLSESDTLSEVLKAPDAPELMDWLRHRPLAYTEHGTLLVHAGVLPQWNLTQVLTYAAEVETVLRGAQWREALANLFANTPASWDEELTAWERLRVIVNALTRMRFCDAQGLMDLHTKSDVDSAPAGLLPWFEVPQRALQDFTIAFGHWSTLGLMLRQHLIAVDTGCVWGQQLTAVRLDDRAVFQVECNLYSRDRIN